MLASIGRMPTDESGWTFEVKWDGVRAVGYVEDGGLKLESRNLRDITPRYPELAGLGEALAGRRAVLDGEVVAFTPEGRPSFGLLQQRMHLASEAEVRRRIAGVPIAYLIFDVLWLDGRDLTGEQWTERRQALESLELGAAHPWQVPATHRSEGAALLAATRRTGLEGVVAKKMDSIYEVGRRSRCWIKVKNHRRQEIVVGGWLPGEGSRTNRLGALLAGYYDDTGALRFAGKVGTGFTQAELVRLGGLLDGLARPTSPFTDKIPYRNANFVEPELVADVEFTEWTSGGTMRHPSYKGQRDDKDAREVTREPDSGMQ